MAPTARKSTKTRTAKPDSRPAIVLPDDARKSLARVPGALAGFEALSYTNRRELVEAITSAKKPETRQRRIVRMVEKLTSTEPRTVDAVSTRPAVAKMGITAGQRVLLLDAEADASAAFASLPKGSEIAREPGRVGFDVVVLYAATAAALARRLPAALRACLPGAVLWVAFPKGSSGRATTLTRDLGWHPTERDDLKRVALISIDDNWSGFKFRRVAS